MVNLDQVMELQTHVKDRGSMRREDLLPWLFQRRRERFTLHKQAVLERLVGETVAEKGFAMLDEGEQRSGSWANRWL
jgi:hypothetical protein